jgi:Late exocytosis, associated with Golgi transport
MDVHGQGSFLALILFNHDVINARFPSPFSPFGWPLSWVKQAVQFPEDKLNELRGLDATIYIRFLRGTCEYYPS